MVMIMNYDAGFENENSEVLMLFGGSNGFKGILIRIIDGHHSSVIVVRVKFMRDMGNTPKETNPGPGILLPKVLWRTPDMVFSSSLKTPIS